MMPARKAITKIAEALCAASPPVQSGVMCFIVRDPTVMLHTRVMVELQVLSAAPIADVPIMATKAVTALYGSGSRDAGFAEVLASRKVKSSTRPDKPHVVRLANCRIFRPLANEGAHVMLEHLKDYGCVAAEQSIVGMPRDEMIDGINRLDAGSRERNGIVLLFLSCPPTYDATWLRQYCDEVFIVDKCEPGPGMSIAYSMTALSLVSQHASGIGRKMYEISEQGISWSSTSSAFIAVKAEDRAIWFARREGQHLETIADWMGVDKSTVKRRQDSLPLSVDIEADVDPTEGWHDLWFPFLGWNVAEDEGDDDAAEDESNDRPKRIG